MKPYFTLLFLLFFIPGFAQLSDSLVVKKTSAHRPTIFTISLGFIDYYTMDYNYSVPPGFQKNNTTGFSPVSAKLEYGLTNNFTLAAGFYYDNFVYNFEKLYFANSITYSRYKNNNFLLLGGGLSVYYYLDKFISVENLETFIIVGFSLNTISQSAFPQGDSTVQSISQIASPVLKFGARYLLSKTKNAGIYFDAGYDKQSIFNIGFSTAIRRLKGKHLRL